MFSYIHTKNGAKSRIDRVNANDEKCSRILHYKHSIHQLGRRRIGVGHFHSVKGKVFWKLNASVLSDRAYLLMLESTLKSVLDLNVNERW